MFGHYIDGELGVNDKKGRLKTEISFSDDLLPLSVKPPLFQV